jgi:hypothetical protein
MARRFGGVISESSGGFGSGADNFAKNIFSRAYNRMRLLC